MTTPYVIRTDERFEAQSVVFPELKSGRRYRVAMGDYIFKTYSGLDYTDGASYRDAVDRRIGFIFARPLAAGARQRTPSADRVATG